MHVSITFGGLDVVAIFVVLKYSKSCHAPIRLLGESI
jgi:hypothetical protein